MDRPRRTPAGRSLTSRLAVGAAIVAVAGLALAEFISGHAARARPAPALPGTVLVGPRETTAALKGEPAIVHFWASWCGPCTHEASQLSSLAHQLHGRARLVGVDWSDSEAHATAFVRAHRWTFPNLEDRAGRAGSAWGISGLPTTFVLDARGRIVARMTGPQTAAGLLARLPRA